MHLVVGIGSARGVTSTAVDGLLARVLGEHGLDRDAVCAYASVDRRRAEPGILAAIAPAVLRAYPAAALHAVAVPTPSEAVRAAAGTRSVAEAAALLAARELAAPLGAVVRLLVPKAAGDRVTVAVAAFIPDLVHRG